MKRALVVVVALCTLGFAGFSQIAIKGKWDATVRLLPSIGLTSSLSLTFTVAGFDITSTTGFGAVGITSQAFSLKGAFGPFSLSGKMRFDPLVPKYEVSQLAASFDFAGIGLGLTVNHWMNDEWDPVYFGYPSGTPNPCGTQSPPLGNLQYILTAKVDPWSVRVRFLDCCTGTAFQDLLVTTKFPLCCGITLDSEFSFTKDGFGYLKLSGINVPLCCGVSMDVEITFTEAAKSVTITPKFAGIAEACFTVWGGPIGDWNYPEISWGGIEIYGFKISCTIADCNYLEIVNAFKVAKVNPYLPAADRFKYDTAVGPLCTDGPSVAVQERELLKLGFCGPGCCGGKYEVAVRFFFGDVISDFGPPVVEVARLFDITRLVFTVKIPIMTNFSVSISGTMYSWPAATPCNSLYFGWEFTF